MSLGESRARVRRLSSEVGCRSSCDLSVAATCQAGVVRHARPDDLDRIEGLLDRIREIDGMVERKPGIFYRGSKAFLHFHVDPAGFFADVKVDGSFQRSRVTTAREQDRLVSLIRRTICA